MKIWFFFSFVLMFSRSFDCSKAKGPKAQLRGSVGFESGTLLFRGDTLSTMLLSMSGVFYSSTILGKIFGAKWGNPVKLDRARKVWYLLLRVFWLLLPKFNFWRRDWALGYTRYHVSVYLWLIGSILKHCKVPKYYDQDCRWFW